MPSGGQEQILRIRANGSSMGELSCGDCVNIVVEDDFFFFFSRRVVRQIPKPVILWGRGALGRKTNVCVGGGTVRILKEEWKLLDFSPF